MLSRFVKSERSTMSPCPCSSPSLHDQYSIWVNHARFKNSGTFTCLDSKDFGHKSRTSSCISIAFWYQRCSLFLGFWLFLVRIFGDSHIITASYSYWFSYLYIPMLPHSKRDFVMFRFRNSHQSAYAFNQTTVKPLCGPKRYTWKVAIRNHWSKWHVSHRRKMIVVCPSVVVKEKG